MSRQTDNELTVCAWSPAWIGGSGVSQLSELLVGEDRPWRIVETVDLPCAMSTAKLDSVRNCGYTITQHDGKLQHSGLIVVAAELTRLAGDRQGSRSRCVVECATSMIPCPVGLHSIDARYEVPEATFASRRGRKADGSAKEVLSNFRAICDAIQPAWAACLTFGRGPSIAELYKRTQSTTVLGALYLDKQLSPRILADLEQLASSRATGSGFEFNLSPVFGGSSVRDEQRLYDLAWSAMRQISLPSVPWEVLSELDG